MHEWDVFGVQGSKPIALGTGLICLDLVYEGDRNALPVAWAGGSCGNVLAILSYLGWQCYPIARLSADFAGQYILRDLQRWDVCLEYAQLHPVKSTPIFIQHIRRDESGATSHTFSSRCPVCGRRLPGYQPVPLAAARTVASNVNTTNIFYLDRVSPSALALARHYREKGALIVYEPSGIGELAHFRDALSLAHIVKYSEERLSELPDKHYMQGNCLEIQTIGKRGLRYRRTAQGSIIAEWQYLPGFQIPYIRDTAGSGDWCTAGLIHYLGQTGQVGFFCSTDIQIKSALRFGQAVAALNCCFIGARGGMYSTTREEFQAAVSRIQFSTYIDPLEAAHSSRHSPFTAAEVCASCIAQ